MNATGNISRQTRRVSGCGVGNAILGHTNHLYTQALFNLGNLSAREDAGTILGYVYNRVALGF